MSHRPPPGAIRRALVEGLPRSAVAVTASGDSPELRRTLSILRDRTDVIGAELLLVLDRWPDDTNASGHRALDAFVDLLVFEPGGDRAAMVNAAARATAAEVLVLTRIGAAPSIRWIPELVGPFTRSPHLACVGGPVEPIFEAGAVPRWYRRLRASRPELDPSPLHRLPDGVREYVDTAGALPRPLPSPANVAWSRSWLLDNPFEAGVASMGDPAADLHAALRLLEVGGRIAHAPAALVHLEVPPSETAEQAVERELRARATGMSAALRALGKPVPAIESDPWPGPWRRLAPRSVRIGRRLARAHAEALQGASNA